MTRRAGFTLIEMSVVILVLAMMAAIIVPGVVSLVRSQKLESFRADSLRLTRQAREAAIERSRSVTLKWEDALIAEIPPNADEEEAQQIGRVEPPDEATLESVIKGADTVSEDEWTITFTPVGKAEEGAIVFESNGAKYFIKIEGETGRITAGRGDPPTTVTESWEAGELEKRSIQ